MKNNMNSWLDLVYFIHLLWGLVYNLHLVIPDIFFANIFSSARSGILNYSCSSSDASDAILGIFTSFRTATGRFENSKRPNEICLLVCFWGVFKPTGRSGRFDSSSTGKIWRSIPLVLYAIYIPLVYSVHYTLSIFNDPGSNINSSEASGIERKGVLVCFWRVFFRTLCRIRGRPKRFQSVRSVRWQRKKGVFNAHILYN